MHKFLRAAGFSLYQKKHDIDALLEKLVREAQPSQIRRLQLDSETNLCRVRVEVAPDIGLDIYGEMDGNGQIKAEYYLPYLLGHDLSSRAECCIQRHTEKETYAGMLDEYKVGITLIFYLENAMEFRARSIAHEPADVDYVKAKVATKERNSLLEAAKRGDESAVESLTMEDIDMYSQISRRVLKEDIYSIIDTSFMPSGIECDQYAVIGDIIHMTIVKNRLTGEEIYIFKLNCNDIVFQMAINRKDLMGEPAVGRRFKGQIWMMGTVRFAH